MSSVLVRSSNPGIRELPVELGRLSNLWQLDTEDLNITNVPQEVRKEGREQLLGDASMKRRFVLMIFKCVCRWC